METLNSLINVMLGLISAGVVVKIIRHLLGLILNIDEKETYIKKVKNCLIAFVLSSSVFVVKEIIEYYFG